MKTRNKQRVMKIITQKCRQLVRCDFDHNYSSDARNMLLKAKQYRHKKIRIRIEFANTTYPVATESQYQCLR